MLAVTQITQLLQNKYISYLLLSNFTNFPKKTFELRKNHEKECLYKC